MATPLPTTDDLWTGALAATAVVGELMAAGAAEAGSPWAPLNAIAPLVLSPDAAEHQDWHPVVTPVGLAITISGIAAWAVLHRGMLRAVKGNARVELPEAVAAGALSAAALACFDYCVLPPARRPRFELWLSTPAIAAKYAVLGAVLALRAPQPDR